MFFTYGQDWVVAWLAASRIGALVMPLATTYRPAEIRTVLRIGDIDTLITAPAVLGHDMPDMLEASVDGLGNAEGPQLFLSSTPYLRRIWIAGATDRTWATTVDLAAPAAAELVADDLVRAVEVEVVPGDLAQVTYTSGSSAEPKGVVHTHGTIVRAHALRSPRCRPPGGAPNRVLLRVPLLLDRWDTRPRRRAPVGCDGVVHRAFRARRRARPHRGRAGHARPRLADPPAVDARPPVVRAA